MSPLSEVSSHPERDPDDDRPRLECGVFGVWNMPDASALVALGLHALQHRGQEACGMASFDGQRFATERHMGHVGDAFGKGDLVARLPGYAAVGHTRYATAGGHAIRNVQPMFADLETGGLAIAHNGNLTNFQVLRRQLVEEGSIFQSTSDSEVILHLIARSRKRRVIDRFINALREIEGGYALVALTNTALIGARDPLGIRPAGAGRGRRQVRAGVGDLRARHHQRPLRARRGARRGGLHNGRRRGEPAPLPRRPRPPVPVRIRLLLPPGLGGERPQRLRRAQGAWARAWREETGVDADVVVPVPDSGVPAALGYAQGSGIPYELGIIRGHYVGRTFIQPTQGVRELGVRMKHSPNRAALAGKRVVLIDDSIVRGTTSVKIVRMVREAGAAEVHLRSASPPILWPDFYGIDMPDREKLIAANKTLAEMQEMLEVDSLGFLSVEGLYWAMGAGPRDDARPQFTDHYFTGDYPTRLTDRELAEGRNEPVQRQLSLLVGA